MLKVLRDLNILCTFAKFIENAPAGLKMALNAKLTKK
jgi:hypothetical protein